MNAHKLIGAIIVIAIVVYGLMSGHMHGAMQAMHATHGLWVIGKGAVIVLAAIGLLVGRLCKASRRA